jgi:hypothetical protein
VYFVIENLPKLIEALQWRLIECGFDTRVHRPETATDAEVQLWAGTAPAASGSSGAARQKRYRQRKRDGGGDVTRDAETVTRYGAPELFFSQAAE